MKKQNLILAIGALIIVILAFLWKFEILEEPDIVIGSSILTALSYLLALFMAKKDKGNSQKTNKDHDSNSRSVTKQQPNAKTKNSININKSKLKGKNINIVGGNQIKKK